MQRLRMGLIGGGPGSFIGQVHRIASELDGRIALVAGAFSSDGERSRVAGESYGIDPARAYPDVATMIAAEAGRVDGIELVAIATPNHLHLSAAQAALEAGIAVMSDKPATATLEQARALAGIVARTGTAYGLTYTYSGYPLVREMRARMADGQIGRMRKLVVEYQQGWLAEPIEQSGNKQAAWRADPSLAGPGGCIGDIGVHAFHLAEFVAGQRVIELCADLSSVVAGRTLDDDCNMLLRFDNGAPGVLTTSQIATGERNGLALRIYGEKAGMVWRQEQPDRLEILHLDGRCETLWGGSAQLGPSAQRASRVPSGHPEGYLEAFANLYRDFADQLDGGTESLVPGIAEGVRGMVFIETAVSGSGQGWVPLEEITR